ncbi:hypothetical protein L4D17_12590 [Vibrio splendidus]|uniref:DUF6538 domain-containing protein n=1 Tax=Vibrio splendidus TaxID=29497 RepID=UPI003D0CA3E7
MRYLYISKSGIWQFRYQISPTNRALFDGCREIKRSLKTSDKSKATLMALELEIQIRTTILNPPKSSPEIKVSKGKHQQIPSRISRKRPNKPQGLSPQEALELFCNYKSSHISPKAVGMLRAKCQTGN